MPRISVLFPAHRVNPFMAEALRSIMNQSFKDFEVLFLDNSVEGIDPANWNFDDRIRHIKLNSRFGLAETLNAGIAISDAEFLARMDYDDISHPERFAKQIQFLETNQDISILGTGAKVIGMDIDDHAKYGDSLRRPHNPSEIVGYLLEKNPLIHPSVMFRSNFFHISSIRYRRSYDGAEDLDFWTRASHVVGIANLDEDLLEYRIHPGQFSREDSLNSVQLALRCRIRHAAWIIIHRPELRLRAIKALARGIIKFVRHYPAMLKTQKFSKFRESKFD